MLLKNGKTLDGGLKIAVVSRDNADPADRALLDAALYAALKHEALAHGTTFNARQFREFLKAHKNNKVRYLFTVAAWSTCSRSRKSNAKTRKPKVIGIAVEFPTVVLKRHGSKVEAHEGIFREDTCFMPDAYRKLIREKPKGMAFPDIGCAVYFEKERMRLMAADGLSLRAECYAGNRKMNSVMNKVGARVGTEQHGTVLQLDCLNPKIRCPVNVEIEYPKVPNGSEPLAYAFLARWSGEGGEEIVASFTDAISTFNQKAVVARVQIASNHRLPKNDILQDVLLSLLSAGQDEMAKLEWGGFTPESPIISLGSRREALVGLMSSSRDELLRQRFTGPVPILGSPVPSMLLHIGLDEPGAIQSALETAQDIRTRQVGSRPMRVVELEAQGVSSRPLERIRSSDMAYAPYYDLGVAA